MGAGLAIAVLVGLAAVFGGKKNGATKVAIGPARITAPKARGKVAVNIGPARIKPAGKVAVSIGPARIRPVQKAPAKVAVRIGPATLRAQPKAKAKPVQVVVKESHYDTAASAVSAARKPGAPPIPNVEAARKVAQPVADHVRNNRKGYDHKRVATFQALAGLKVDGLYGPQTAKALRALGAKSVVS